MRDRFFILLLVISLLGITHPTPAFAQAQVVNPSVEYAFGETLAFRARFQADEQVQEVFIFFQAEADARTLVKPVVATQVADNLYDLSYTHDLSAQPLRSFSEVTYHYKVTYKGAQVYTSPSFSFYYEDNRFEWQRLEEKPFRVHWYEGDVAFGQAVLDVAKTGLQHATTLLSFPSPNRVDIYIYPNAAEMKATLDLSGVSWVAGHADPDLGVMAVALPAGPEQRLLMDQRIPHELMHILTYQSLGQTYANLPVWLSEGLASIAELYPNPDYQVLLNNAQRKDSLLAMSSLCQAFPRDASSALLAYAQAASFTRYLYNKFGISGFQALLDNYADGLDCGRAVESALGYSLVQLERQWRQDTFAENASLNALNNLLPWFVLLLAALAAPLGLTLGRLRRREVSPVGD